MVNLSRNSHKILRSKVWIKKEESVVDIWEKRDIEKDYSLRSWWEGKWKLAKFSSDKYQNGELDQAKSGSRRALKD